MSSSFPSACLGPTHPSRHDLNPTLPFQFFPTRLVLLATLVTLERIPHTLLALHLPLLLYEKSASTTSRDIA